ncbi:MAG: type V CRISPR-associated protein Cas12b [Deltaproteobacteria bacterium]|nr:type V CRISPR-associated protein Cas12b [Deltaproteobacteria bacterium]
MEQKFMLPTTQRAYTLRLRGTDPQDASWRENLWKTHEAVNKGAKAFGDWLLTMRGGLCHTLADTKDKRIILALSWLSVESEKGAPVNHIVSHDLDIKSGKRRNWKILDALKEILRARGVSEGEIAEWAEDCKASLSADIREDAVWIDRSKAFDDEVENLNGELTRNDALSLTEEFFGQSQDYLAPIFSEGDSEDSEESNGRAVSSAGEKEFSTLARGWLSRNWGAGNKTDKQKIAANLKRITESDIENTVGKPVQNLFSHIIITLGGQVPEYQDKLYVVAKGTIGWGTGRDSKGVLVLKSLQAKDNITQEDINKLRKKFVEESVEKDSGVSSKIPDWMSNKRILLEKEVGINFRSSRDLIGEFSVMLDHAARRVSLAHTWIKRAEAERRQFEEDSSKITRIPADARNWLDRFCESRSLETGSIEAYRIRKRAVDGWKEVIKEWSKYDCKTETDRIAAARSLQDDKEIDKFGDIQLFEALASDDADCVWRVNGKTDPQSLVDYVAATDAEAKKRRFKVPAYRHPDPLLHPIFCDFGNSRWDILFAMHEAAKKGKKLVDKHALSMKLWTGSEVKDIDLRWQSKLLGEDLPSPVCVPNDSGKSMTVTRASRLSRAAAGAPKEASVNIAGLFEQKDWNGRLQAPRTQLEELSEYVDEHGWTDRARSMRDSIRWLVTFSAKLQPQGPWIDYTNTFSDDAPAKPFVSRKGEYAVKHQSNALRQGLGKLILSRLPGLRLLSIDLGHRYAAACAVWEAISSEKMSAMCVKAGLEPPKPDDLYLHLKSQDGKKTTIYRRIGADTVEGTDKNTGESKDVPHPAPWARLDRQFLIKLQGEVREPRMATADEIWKLHELEKELGLSRPLIDRLVKAGWGKNSEYPYQQKILKELENMGWKAIEGQTQLDKDEENITRRQSLSVDDLMSSAIDTIRLALQRHGDRARIAYAMKAEYKTLPGNQKYWFISQKGDTEEKKKERQNEHEKFMLQTLMLWHGLATGKKYNDSEARELWNAHLVALGAPKAEDTEELSSAERKRYRKELEKKLEPVAQKLSQNEPLRIKLRVASAVRWRKEDGLPRFEGVLDAENKPTGKKIDNGQCTGWHDRIKQLNNWILPRGISKVYKDEHGKWVKEIQRDRLKDSINVGGLSLTRIATIKSLYQVQKAFFTRFTPEGRQMEDGKPTTTGEGFGQSILDTLEQMRENRVKQLASRIAEAALGIGIEQDRVNKKDPKRPRERINIPRFALCHAIIVENLTHYRPEETRTRRENRQLMDWSAAKVKKYLSEACELNGLHFREVPAGYTSRQDSRTGAPGVRCSDISVAEFVRPGGYLSKRIKNALENVEKGKGSEEGRFLCEVYARWDDNSKSWRDTDGVTWTLGKDGKWTSNGKALDPKQNHAPKPVRIPQRGGEIFVSADKNSPASKGLQADLNAAANIGLKALLDPDWPGRWWYVPCDSKEFKLVADKVKGSAVFQDIAALKSTTKKENSENSESTGKRNVKKDKSRELVNLWRDPSGAKISDGWRTTPEYWNQVQSRVVQNLLK